MQLSYAGYQTTWVRPATRSLTHLIGIAGLYREVISDRELLVVMFDPLFFRHFLIVAERRLDPNTGPQLYVVKQSV